MPSAAAPTTASIRGVAQPPCSKPPRRSSSGRPGACMTPSSVIFVNTTTLLMSSSDSSHELRNEVVEERILDRVSESGAELDTLLVSRGNPKGRRAKRAEDEEKHSCPRRRDIVTDEVVLCRCFRCEPERGGKAFWDAEQLDRDLASRWIPRMASEAFCPRKARVRPLRTGKHHIPLTWRSDGGRREAHPDALVSHGLLTPA